MISKERLKIISLWLILSLANFIIYFPIIKGYFYYDDFQFFRAYQDAPNWYSGVIAQFQHGYALRFFLDLILWSRFKIFGWSPAPYFVISILQNILVGLLVYIFAQMLFHRTRISFTASLITTIAFPPIQVITWITGSIVSLLACFYLGTVILFVQYLATRRTGWYIGFLLCFFVATYSLEYAISLLPVLFVIAFFLGREHGISFSRAALPLAPCLVLLIPYGILQSRFIHQGTSEAQIGGGIGLGLHIFPAFLNLSHLIVPDLHFPRLVNFLTASFPPGLQIIAVLAPVALVIWIGLTAFVLIKGSAQTRMLMVWIYLVFAPLTLWLNPDTAHSSRYLYLPMIAFSILLALFIDWAAQRLASLKLGSARLWGAVLVGAWLLYNLIPIYIFQTQEVAKGQLRRTIIEQIQALHPDFPAGSKVYIGVPDQNYRDLGWGIPNFYSTPISVVTVPPSDWPQQQTAGEYFFTFDGGALKEKSIP